MNAELEIPFDRARLPSVAAFHRIADERGNPPWLRGRARPVQSDSTTLMPLRKIMHEIRDPLSLILLTAERSLRGTQDSTIIDAFKLICEETRRAEHIMQGTLERASGKRSVKPICELNTVVRRAVAEAQRYSATRTPDCLTWELDLIEPTLQVRMNAAAIEQVIVNLIKNAVEAANGVLHIVVRTVHTLDVAEVVVSDNGRGIPADTLPRIFDPFVSTKHEIDGRGLGLSICKEIVTDHGGQLLAVTEAGQGSTFTLRLPLAVTALDCQ